MRQFVNLYVLLFCTWFTLVGKFSERNIQCTTNSLSCDIPTQPQPARNVAVDGDLRFCFHHRRRRPRPFYLSVVCPPRQRPHPTIRVRVRSPSVDASPTSTRYGVRTTDAAAAARSQARLLFRRRADADARTTPFRASSSEGMEASRSRESDLDIGNWKFHSNS